VIYYLYIEEDFFMSQQNLQPYRFIPRPAPKVRKKVFGGYDMSYMFRNEKRMSAMKKTNAALSIIGVLGIVVMIIAGVAAVFGIVALVFSIITLLVFATGADWFAQFMVVCGIGALVGLGLFLLSFVPKFIMSWVFILAELRELVVTKEEENQKYIRVSKNVLATKGINLGFLIAIPTLLVLGGYFVIVEHSNTGLLTLGIVILVLALVTFIVNRIYNNKQFKKLQPDLQAISDVRHEEAETKRVDFFANQEIRRKEALEQQAIRQKELAIKQEEQKLKQAELAAAKEAEKLAKAEAKAAKKK